jgi:ribosomal protein S8
VLLSTDSPGFLDGTEENVYIPTDLNLQQNRCENLQYPKYVSHNEIRVYSSNIDEVSVNISAYIELFHSLVV